MNSLIEHINYLLKNGQQVTIESADLTRILTRLILRLENVHVQHKRFLFVEQTRTELSLVESL